jgi:hypothetical protein
MVFYQRKAPYDSRSPFVDIEKQLKIWNENHNEQALLKGIFDLVQLFQKYSEFFFQSEFVVERNIRASSYFNDFASDDSQIVFRKQSLSQQGMNLEKSPFVEFQFPFVMDHVLDGFFVVQHHLGFFVCFFLVYFVVFH